MKIIMIFQFRLILPKKLMSRTTAGMSGDERIAPPPKLQVGIAVAGRFPAIKTTNNI